MREQVWIYGIAFTFSVLVAGPTTQSAAEEPLQQPSWFAAAPSLSTPADPGEIETAISKLSEPFDQEQMNKIFLDLARLEDFKERDRLQAMLDERMQEIMKFPAPPTAQFTIKESLSKVRSNPKASAVVDGPSYNELLVKIDTSNLGPDATADDLRARNQIVSQIAGIRDPIMRDELLTRLEEREREAEGVAKEH